MLDNTQLNTYKSCPFQYLLRYKSGYKRREEGVAEHHASFGSAIHKGLEAIYNGKTALATDVAFASEYPTQLDETDLAKTQENGLILLQAYNRWRVSMDSDLEILSVEKPFTFQAAPGHDYLIKPDLVVRKRSTQEIYGLDHKTTEKSLKSNRYWNQFDPSDSITSYCAGIEAEFGSCGGLWINALSCGYRKKKYKGEPAGFHYDFQRQLFTRTAHQVEQWRIDLAWWLAQKRETERSQHWGKNAPGACYFCSFRPICQAGWNPEHDAEQIEVLYEVMENPLEYQEQP